MPKGDGGEIGNNPNQGLNGNSENRARNSKNQSQAQNSSLLLQLYKLLWSDRYLTVAVIFLALKIPPIIKAFWDFFTLEEIDYQLEALFGVSRNDTHIKHSGFIPSPTEKKIKDYLKIHKDLNAVNIDGETILHIAARSNKIYIIQLLLNNKASIKSKDNNGNTPLQIAIINKKKEAIECFIERGAEINIANFSGLTPLMQAVVANDESIVKFLITKGANVNALDFEKCSALIYALFNSNLFMAQILLDHNANINLQDINGYTVLHTAVERGDKRIVKWLLKHEADPTLKNKFGQTPLDLIAESELSLAEKYDLKLLLTKHYDYACKNKALIESADVEQVDFCGLNVIPQEENVILENHNFELMGVEK